MKDETETTSADAPVATDSAFAILDDVQEPARKPRTLKYPYESMQPGQAFFAPDVKTIVVPKERFPDAVFKTWIGEREGVQGVYVKRVS